MQYTCIYTYNYIIWIVGRDLILETWALLKWVFMHQTWWLHQQYWRHNSKQTGDLACPQLTVRPCVCQFGGWQSTNKSRKTHGSRVMFHGFCLIFGIKNDGSSMVFAWFSLIFTINITEVSCRRNILQRHVFGWFGCQHFPPAGWINSKGMGQQEIDLANYRGKSSTVPIYVPMIYLYHRLEMVGATLYYLLLFIAQAASSTNPPQPWLSPAFWFSSKISARATQYLQLPLPWRLPVDSGGSQTAMGSDHCRDSHPLWMTGWWFQLWKIWKSVGKDYPIYYGTIKHVPNHQPVIDYNVISFRFIDLIFVIIDIYVKQNLIMWFSPCKSQFYQATIWGWFRPLYSTVILGMVYDDPLPGGTLQHLQAVSNRRSPGRRSWTYRRFDGKSSLNRHFNIYKTASWMVLHGSSTRFCSHLVRILNFDLWLHLNMGPVGQDFAP